MDLLLAILLGILQGVTEWLPISSSGHLVLFQHIFGEANDVVYDIMVHGGTLLAVIVFFWKDFIMLLRNFVLTFADLPRLKGNAFFKDAERRLTWYILLATLPIVVVGILLQDYIDVIFNSLTVVGIGFIITGIWLLSTSKMRGKEKADLKKSILIGLAQSLAIFPGVSRSGSTIATGMLLKMEKEKAARFSFLLSIPAIGGAFVYKILKTPLANVFTIANIAGFFTAFIVGILTIKFLLYVIKRGRFYAFGFYTICLGILVLLYQLIS
ncbi:undecaprenyl-diphosphatase [Euryarchaeota archaeon ex4484_178]|nr:MAG: undecaprenyl-diphosphatase [Euryarchaeota archaeon ex4484_178]